jgi:mannose-6-phosphate isomerase-like protein (cupin superfamily)
VPLDELVGAPPTGDPRVHLQPMRRGDETIIALNRQPGGLRAFKHIIPAGSRLTPEPKTHEGYEWMYVLNGRLRLVLGPHDVIMKTGEVAEFDTHVPHWFGNGDDRPVEILSLFGPQGERMHVRAAPRQS